MRWYVDISSVGAQEKPGQRYCVEAEQWQKALQTVRAKRGDDSPFGSFSIELLDEGYRAIDPLTRTRFVVHKAPDSAALSEEPLTLGGGEPAPSGDAATAKLEAPRARPSARGGRGSERGRPSRAARAPSIPNDPVPRTAAAEPVTQKRPSATPAPIVPAPVTPIARPMQAATAFERMTGGTAVPLTPEPEKAPEAVSPVAPAPSPAPSSPAVASPAPSSPGSAAPSSAPGHEASTEVLPSFTVLTRRSEEWTQASPLTYRESALAVSSSASLKEAEAIARAQFELLRNAIADAPKGKFIQLAVFDHEFSGRPKRPPVVTLTFKDWRHLEPEIQYPARDGAPSKPPPRSMPPAEPPPPTVAPPTVAPATVAPATVPSAPPPSMPAPSAPAPSAPAPSAPAPSAPAPSAPAPSAPVSAGPAPTPRIPSAPPVAASPEEAEREPALEPIRPTPVIAIGDAGVTFPNQGPTVLERAAPHKSAVLERAPVAPDVPASAAAAPAPAPASAPPAPSVVTPAPAAPASAPPAPPSSEPARPAIPGPTPSELRRSAADMADDDERTWVKPDAPAPEAAPVPAPSSPPPAERPRSIPPPTATQPLLAVPAPDAALPPHARRVLEVGPAPAEATAPAAPPQPGSFPPPPPAGSVPPPATRPASIPPPTHASVPPGAVPAGSVPPPPARPASIPPSTSMHPSGPPPSRLPPAGLLTKSGAGPRKGGDDLITDLFEACSDLAFVPDVLEAAEFVLDLVHSSIPSQVVLVSFFDINAREMVVVRQAVVDGREPLPSVVLSRASEFTELIARSMRSGRALVVASPETDLVASDARWRALGVVPGSLICSPVKSGGRYLGLIEAADPVDGRPFTDGDGHALTYIGEQFAEYLGQREVVLDPDRVTRPKLAHLARRP